MTTSTNSSTYHGEAALSPTASSFAGTSTYHHSSYSSYAASPTGYPISPTATGTDHLRDVFNKRIRSLVHLKRSLLGQRTWFSTIQLNPEHLRTAFDNERMHKRTLRYSLLGLSLSSILEIGNASDMARAIVSLVNELEGYTDDNIVALTSGTGAANFGAQRPRMRSFFKSGKQSLKRSTAAQAISDFGTVDSNMGSASTFAGTSNEQASYLIVPNIPFQLDFFQTLFTLCDMLTEVYYKMLSFLPRDAAATTAHAADATGDPGAPSPPLSASTTAQDHDKSVTIAQALSDLYGDSAGDKAGASGGAAPGLGAMTQELLLKADAKIKKTISAQVKDVDSLARQTIKDELASLDPLLKDLGIDSGGSSSAVFPSSQTGGASAHAGSGGLPTSSASSLPFGMSNQSSAASSSATLSNTTAASTTQSKLSNFIPASSLPSHFRRGNVKPEPRTSSHDAAQGHHHINLSSVANDANGGGMGSLIRSRSGRLKRAVSRDKDLPMYPASSSVSPTKES